MTDKAQPRECDATGEVRDALARRLLWIAFCWNDHNFQDGPEKYAVAEAKKHGINSFEDANRWLAASPQPAQPGVTDDQIDALADKYWTTYIGRYKFDHRAFARELLASTPAQPGMTDALDAARYRWLRENKEVILCTSFFGNGCINKTVADVDAAIDAARASGKT